MSIASRNFAASNSLSWLPRLACLAVVSLCFACNASAQEFSPLLPIFDEPQQVRLLRVEENVATFLDKKNHETPVPFSKFVRWGTLQEAVDVDQVLMTDGSIFVGRNTAINGVHVVLETSNFGELSLPRSSVRAVIWKLPTDSLDQWKFRDELSQQADKARIVLRNGDSLVGKLVSGDGRKLRFDADAGETELNVELVSAWQSSEANIADDQTPIVLGLRDGTKLVAEDVRLDHRLQVKLACGMHLGTLSIVRPVDEQLIVYLQSSNPNVNYLSRSQSIGHKHIPYLNAKWDWQQDRSVVGGPISSHAKLYERGIGMHSTARLALDLPAGFSEFQAEGCIDRSSGKLGSVVFRVFTTRDGAKWNAAFKTEIVRGGDEPVPIRVKLDDARRLALVVDFADQADQLDRANWIGARLVK